MQWFGNFVPVPLKGNHLHLILLLAKCYRGMDRRFLKKTAAESMQFIFPSKVEEYKQKGI
jgi:hypothetical protein